jgi:hypothetical protein
MHDPVTEPFGLMVSWVVAGSVVGKLSERTGVPVFAPLTLGCRALVNNIEAMASRAKKSAGPTSNATLSQIGPQRVLKIIIKPLLELFELYPINRWFSKELPFAMGLIDEELLVCGDKPLTFFRYHINRISPLHKRRQKKIRSPTFIGATTDSSAETAIIGTRTGHTNYGCFGSPLQKKFIPIVPGEHGIKHRHCGGVTGAYSEKYGFRNT